jgi:mitochondrial fission protein ELM1
MTTTMTIEGKWADGDGNATIEITPSAYLDDSDPDVWLNVGGNTAQVVLSQDAARELANALLTAIQEQARAALTVALSRHAGPAQDFELSGLLTDDECIHAFDSPDHLDGAHSKLGLAPHNESCGQAEYLALTEDERVGLAPGDICIHARANNAIAGRANTLLGI